MTVEPAPDVALEPWSVKDRRSGLEVAVLWLAPGHEPELADPGVWARRVDDEDAEPYYAAKRPIVAPLTRDVLALPVEEATVTPLDADLEPVDPDWLPIDPAACRQTPIRRPLTAAAESPR